MWRIEKPERNDIAEIAAMQCAVALESEGLELDPDVTLNGVARLLDEPVRGFYLVARTDTAVIGCLQVIREWSDWWNAEIWSLHSMYVVPEYRRRGVFRSLFGEVVRRARADGVIRLRVPVAHANKAGTATCFALGLAESDYSEYVTDPRLM